MPNLTQNRETPTRGIPSPGQKRVTRWLRRVNRFREGLTIDTYEIKRARKIKRRAKAKIAKASRKVNR